MRRMVGDGQDVYRVVVVRKKKIVNPKYRQGYSDQSYYLLLDETYETQYGPYNELGTAKRILTRESYDRSENRFQWDAVGGRIEKATTTWTKVEL